MIPLQKVQNIISNYEGLEKDLSSSTIDKKKFAIKSKEYSSISEIIKEARTYVNFNKEKEDLYKIIDDKTKERMKEILKDIQTGKFAKQWMNECKNGQKNFLEMREKLSEHPIEKVGKKLRDLMPWIGKNKLVDKAKN